MKDVPAFGMRIPTWDGIGVPVSSDRGNVAAVTPPVAGAEAWQSMHTTHPHPSWGQAQISSPRQYSLEQVWHVPSAEALTLAKPGCPK
eukprot:gene3678-biopygen12165